jgi:hypothetical protein
MASCAVRIDQLKNLSLDESEVQPSKSNLDNMRYMDLTVGFCLDPHQRTLIEERSKDLNRKLEPASFLVDSGMPRPYKGLRNRPVSSQ